jgi:hypothetical protein
MTTGMAISLVINILVGLYFALLYPKSVEKNFRGRQPPPFFAFMVKILPPFGWGLVIASVAFGGWKLLA